MRSRREVNDTYTLVISPTTPDQVTFCMLPQKVIHLNPHLHNSLLIASLVVGNLTRFVEPNLKIPLEMRSRLRSDPKEEKGAPPLIEVCFFQEVMSECFDRPRSAMSSFRTAT